MSNLHPGDNERVLLRVPNIVLVISPVCSRYPGLHLTLCHSQVVFSNLFSSHSLDTLGWHWGQASWEAGGVFPHYYFPHFIFTGERQVANVHYLPEPYLAKKKNIVESCTLLNCTHLRQSAKGTFKSCSPATQLSSVSWYFRDLL